MIVFIAFAHLRGRGNAKLFVIIHSKLAIGQDPYIGHAHANKAYSSCLRGEPLLEYRSTANNISNDIHNSCRI